MFRLKIVNGQAWQSTHVRQLAYLKDNRRMKDRVLMKTLSWRYASTLFSLALFPPQTLGRTPWRSLRAHLRRKITKIVRLAPASSAGYWLMDSSYHGIYDVVGDVDLGEDRRWVDEESLRRRSRSRWWSTTVSLGGTYTHAYARTRTHAHTRSHAHESTILSMKGGERKWKVLRSFRSSDRQDGWWVWCDEIEIWGGETVFLHGTAYRGLSFPETVRVVSFINLFLFFSFP